MQTQAPSNQKGERRPEHYKPLFPKLKFEGLCAKAVRQSALRDSNVAALVTHCKSAYCKHEDGCIAHTVDISAQGLFIGFATMFGIKTLMALVKAVTKPSAKAFLRVLFNVQNCKDAFRFALFPLVYNFVLQTSQCVLRRVLKRQSGEVAFLAGALAGFFSLMTRERGNRAIWGVFLLSRAFECFYNSLLNRGVIKKVSYDWVLIFAFMWLFEGYNFQTELNNCPPSLIKFGNFVTNQDELDCDRARILSIQKGRELMEKYGDDVEFTNPRTLIPYTKKRLATNP